MDITVSASNIISTISGYVIFEYPDDKDFSPLSPSKIEHFRKLGGLYSLPVCISIAEIVKSGEFCNDKIVSKFLSGGLEIIYKIFFMTKFCQPSTITRSDWAIFS